MKTIQIAVIISAGAILSSCFNENPAGTDENLLVMTSSAIDTLTTIDSLRIKTDPVVWIWDTIGFSTLKIAIKGTTNAHLLSIETYGDGAIVPYGVNLDSAGGFKDTVGLAFSHVSGFFLRNNTKLKLYSVGGDSTEIVLKNPKQ